ncbi:MAG: class D sortase [Bacteroidota bacterium]
MSAREGARRIVSRVLITGGALLLLFVASVSIRSYLLARENEGSPRVAAFAATSTAVRRYAATTGRIGTLDIPRLGLRVPVVEGDDNESLLSGVGHVPDTAYPGERENAALAGHRDTHFAKLRGIEPGDSIRVETPGGTYLYQVDSAFVVMPDRGDLLDHTGRATLTLVTCYPFHWIGPAPKRFIVRAHGLG